MTVSRITIIVAGCALAAACRGRGGDAASAQAVGDTIGAARRAAVIPIPASQYHAVTVQGGGRVTGVVEFTGTPSGDTVIVVPPDQNGCGKQLTIQRLVRRAGHVSGAIVWITDVREGAALPLDKRFELENNDCAWSATVQPVIAGGTLNVANYDPLAERGIVTEVATGDTVALAPFTDNGQVIPYDRLLQKPGLFEFSIESRPMSRAWIAVFDHPYFAVTDTNGAFTIDGVPTGTHHVRAWHPMLGVVDGTVTVAANGSASVNLAFPAR